jgi:hypothetical protein
MKESVVVSEGVTESKGRVSTRKAVARKSAHVLYVLLDSVCMIVFAYEIYLWIKSGKWIKIPTGVVIVHVTGWRSFAHAGEMGRGVFHWVLNVDIVWVLSIIAIIFFAIRWLMDRKIAQEHRPDV